MVELRDFRRCASRSGRANAVVVLGGLAIRSGEMARSVQLGVGGYGSGSVGSGLGGDLPGAAVAEVTAVEPTGQHELVSVEDHL